VIAGFNTDVEYNGEIYHVQTEDKGLRTAMIVSLVYQGGTILASKRSSYSDLLVDGVVTDKKALTERVHKQHKLICAAIKAGRIEDLKRLAAKEAAVGTKEAFAEKETAIHAKEVSAEKEAAIYAKDASAEKEALEKKAAISEMEALPGFILKTADIIVPEEALKEVSDVEVVEMPVEVVEEVSEAEIVEEVEELEAVEVTEAIQEVEEIKEPEKKAEKIEESILAQETVETSKETAGMIEVSDEEETAEDQKLSIELLGHQKFKGGDQKVLSLLVTKGQDKQAVKGSQVTVKILGSSFRPQVYHGETDENGLAIFRINIPHFKSGKAAILVKAFYNGEESEVKQIVKPG
jgi:hypothetical protein